MAVWLLKTLLGRFLIINSLLTHLDISKYNYFCTRSLYSQRNLFNNNISNGSESRFTVSVIAQSESRTTLSHSQLSNNYRLIGWFSRVLKYSNTHVVVSNISGYAASYWDIHVPRASRADPPPQYTAETGLEQVLYNASLCMQRLQGQLHCEKTNYPSKFVIKGKINQSSFQRCNKKVWYTNST